MRSARIQHGHRARSWPKALKYFHQRSVSQIPLQRDPRCLKNAKTGYATLHIGIGLIDNDAAVADVTPVDAALGELPGERPVALAGKKTYATVSIQPLQSIRCSELLDISWRRARHHGCHTYTSGHQTGVR